MNIKLPNTGHTYFSPCTFRARKPSPLLHPTSVIRIFWYGNPSRAQACEILIGRNFRKYFVPKRLYPLFGNDILLIRGKNFGLLDYWGCKKKEWEQKKKNTSVSTNSLMNSWTRFFNLRVTQCNTWYLFQDHFWHSFLSLFIYVILIIITVLKALTSIPYWSDKLSDFPQGVHLILLLTRYAAALTSWNDTTSASVSAGTVRCCTGVSAGTSMSMVICIYLIFSYFTYIHRLSFRPIILFPTKIWKKKISIVIFVEWLKFQPIFYLVRLFLVQLKKSPTFFKADFILADKVCSKGLFIFYSP